ncbi:MAG: CG0192-related protein [Acidimicrobiales bacterium]
MVRVAVLHEAKLTPTKLDFLTAWVPTQTWVGNSDTSALEVVGSYRFDDPGGQVGIETHMLRAADDSILHVPTTYRPAPLAGAETSLITTAEHSVLGTRWIYDGCVDPIYALALATAILTGGHEADLELLTESGSELRAPTMRVCGSGSSRSPLPIVDTVTYTSSGTTSVISAAHVELSVLRAIGEGEATEMSLGLETLTGTLLGHDREYLLAFARR